MKKAYIIPLVILLLFVSVLPCFAEVETNDSSIHADVHLRNGSNLPFQFNSKNLGFISYDLDIPANSNPLLGYISLLSDHYYLVIKYCSDSSVLTNTSQPYLYLDSSNRIFVHDLEIIQPPASGSYNIRFNNYGLDAITLDLLSVAVLDVTDIYPTNASDVVSYYNISLTVPVSTGDVVFFHEDLGQGLLYQLNFLKVFEIYGEWNNIISPLFIVFISITSVLLIIFLVVFMIKRFTGGKC